jgi:hypothetical protein
MTSTDDILGKHRVVLYEGTRVVGSATIAATERAHRDAASALTGS